MNLQTLHLAIPGEFDSQNPINATQSFVKTDTKKIAHLILI